MISLPDYKVIEVIFESDVYVLIRAESVNDGRPVLISAVNTDSLNYEKAREIDARIVKMISLDIPGVVKCIDSIRNKGWVALIMEDSQGIPLVEYLEEHRPGFENRLRLARSIVEIICALHKVGLQWFNINEDTLFYNRETEKIIFSEPGHSLPLSFMKELLYYRRFVEKRLPYIAPEEISREDGGASLLSDLYSLGILLYRVFTGFPPFPSSDSRDIIDAQRNRNPIPPQRRDKNIPPVLSQIILKLIAKEPANRYRSCHGLMLDLQKSLEQLYCYGRIHDFEVATMDRQNAVLTGGRLYGRERELQELEDSFSLALSGECAFVTVSGVSGIGKTSLVQGLFRDNVEERCFFISGKCPQGKEVIPYQPIISAFRELICNILNESSGGIDLWRESVADQLGDEGAVVVNVIPEVAELIGPQPPVPELGPDETLNRFNIVFTNFIKAFADYNHPLVVFLDDMHWADTATLTIISLMLNDAKMNSMLIIGAYRDNEVSEYHNLSIMKNNLRKGGIHVADIPLSSLDEGDTTELICNYLSCVEPAVRPLSEFIYNQTGGNPFHIYQFLKSLRDEKLIQKDENGTWHWNIEHIKRDFISGDVDSLVLRKLKKLSGEEIKILKTASCIGDTFETWLTALVTGLEEVIVENYLRGLSASGFVSPVLYDYHFTHDQIHETVSSMIDVTESMSLHRSIGYHLLQNREEGGLDTAIFRIVYHLNTAVPLLSEDEKSTLARLNAEAGKKAMLSSAFESAVHYYSAGISVLPENCWETDYDFTINLSIESFRCYYILHNYEKAYEIYHSVMANSRSEHDRMKLLTVNIMLLHYEGRLSMSIKTGIETLNRLGIRIKDRPGKIDILINDIKIKHKFSTLGREGILRLPDMTDDRCRNIMELLHTLIMPSYASHPRLRKMIALKMAGHVLSCGFDHLMPLAMMVYAMDFQSGQNPGISLKYDPALLGLKLSKRSMSQEMNCELYFYYGAFLAHWRHHLDTAVEYLVKAYQVGLESGDLYYSRLACTFHVTIMTLKGSNLDDTIIMLKRYFKFVDRGKSYPINHSFQVVLRIISELRGSPVDLGMESSGSIHESDYVLKLVNFELSQPLHGYLTLEFRNKYLFGRYEEALEMATVNRDVVESHFSTVLVPEYYFFYCLTMLALYQATSMRKKILFIKTVRRFRRILKRWALQCPENFRHKYLLVEAELCRIRRKHNAAMRLYDEAAESALENRYTQNWAISSELAARYYYNRGITRIAMAYLNSALEGYENWGAFAKVEQLTFEFRDLLKGKTITERASSGTVAIDRIPEQKKHEGFDSKEIQVLGMLKTIRSETSVPRLCLHVLELFMEISSASKGILILARGDRWFIEGEVIKNNNYISSWQHRPLKESQSLSLAIIKEVIRSRDNLVIKDAVETEEYNNDPYIIKESPGLIAAMPLKNGDELAGIVYLESSEDRNFLEDRMLLLDLSLSVSTLTLLNCDLSYETSPVNSDQEEALNGEDESEALMQQLNSLMVEERLYTVEDLTVSVMAQELSISTQQLSRLLNDKLHVNFNTYVNKYRIDEAKKLLLSEPDRSVISIAYEVGFSSMSPFYSAFMKFTGFSPTVYRQNMNGSR